MQRKDLKILLLQIRDDPKVRYEELESFAKYSELLTNQIDVLNVFDTPSFNANVLDGYHALFVGGASEANVLQPKSYPFVEDSIKLVSEAKERSLPTFASCFGFQLAILAFGGEILHKENNYEMGSIPITLTNLANIDPIYQGINSNFPALSIHRQYANKLPDNLDLLAYTSECIHSFKYRDRPLWAFQFHPEVDKSTVFQRLAIYKEEYTENEEEFQQVLESLVETPESHQLVKNFIDRVVLAA